MKQASTFPHAMDVQVLPPRHWITDTLVFDQPERLGVLLRSEATFNTDGEDDRLAMRILAQAPFYGCGKVTLNRYAHGAWALTIAQRDEEAWKLIGKISPFVENLRMSKAVLRMFIFLALRRHDLTEATKGLVALGKWYRGMLDQEDLSLRDAFLCLHKDMNASREASV